MLHVTDLTFRIEGRPLLEGTSLRVADGQRVGLVGRNGCGKTTLFRLIAGELQPDSGELTLRRGARLGRVRQEPPPGGRSLLATVLAADAERDSLLAEAETATDPQRIAEIHERLDAIGAHAAEARAGTILAGLGFDAAAQARDVAEFSGGWQMRVQLAACLFARPDLLLLDEPTNHLDLEAALWLQDYLANWPGTLVIISHDRELLDSVPRHIAHVEERRITQYNGNYSSFERTRRERLELQARAHARQQEQIARIQRFIDRFRAQANKARQAQSRIKMLERMEPIQPVMESEPYDLSFPDPEALPPPLVALDGISVGYTPEQPVLRDLNLRLDQDDRIALLGANGNGKSTLARLLAGRLDPAGGRVTRHNKLRVGYFAQHQADELDPAGTPFDHMQRARPDLQPTRVRALLGRFHFGQERADIRVGDLSGGERARLLLALATRDAPHLLILDEPTNHLDIEAREALVQALNAFQGAVVLVSHDPHMLELVADRLWLVADGTVRGFDGDLNDYRRHLLEEKRRARAATAADSGKGDKGPTRRDERRAAADRRARLAPLRKRLRAAESRMEEAAARKAALEAELGDPALYEGPAEVVAERQRALGEAETALAGAEEAWLALSEELDNAD